MQIRERHMEGNLLHHGCALEHLSVVDRLSARSPSSGSYRSELPSDHRACAAGSCLGVLHRLGHAVAPRNPVESGHWFHGKAAGAFRLKPTTDSRRRRPPARARLASGDVQPSVLSRSFSGSDEESETSAQRVSMRKIRAVPRLTFACGLSKRQVAPIAGVSATTVREYVTRARPAGQGWPLPNVPADQRPQPDWAALHRELRRQGVTLLLPPCCCHPAVALGGVAGPASQRLQLFLVLRLLSRLGGAGVADAAAGPSRRRAAVRGPRRPQHRPPRSPNGSGPHRPDLHRRAGGRRTTPSTRRR